jgi:hypothetical protein
LKAKGSILAISIAVVALSLAAGVWCGVKHKTERIPDKECVYPNRTHCPPTYDAEAMQGSDSLSDKSAPSTDIIFIQNSRR